MKKNYNSGKRKENMDRETFLRELRIALQGQISQVKVNENLAYYENYIIEQSRKGRTEEQVIEELGNPRLIAKTIIDTTDVLYNSSQWEEEKETEQNVYGNEKGFHFNFDEKTGWDIRYGKFKINSWYGYVIIACLVILILVIIARTAIILLPILVPVLLAGAIIYFLFSGNRK